MPILPIAILSNDRGILWPVRLSRSVGLLHIEQLQRRGAWQVGEAAGGARAGDVHAVAVAASLGGGVHFYTSI